MSRSAIATNCASSAAGWKTRFALVQIVRAVTSADHFRASLQSCLNMHHCIIVCMHACLLVYSSSTLLALSQFYSCTRTTSQSEEVAAADDDDDEGGNPSTMLLPADTSVTDPFCQSPPWIRSYHCTE